MRLLGLSLLLSASTAVVAQGEMALLYPATPLPADCAATYAGVFTLDPSLSRPRADRRPGAVCDDAGHLSTTLKRGMLFDAQGRIGSIVANRQFQYDGPPPQAGAVITAGFGICPGGVLAVGAQERFYACDSGAFSNLYDSEIGGQCTPVYLVVSDVVQC